MIKNEVIYVVCRFHYNNCYDIAPSFIKSFTKFSLAYDYLLDLRRINSAGHYFIRKFKNLGVVNG